MTSDDATGDATGKETAGADYAERLRRLETAGWKQLLDVQAPYRWHLRRLRLGRTLEIGCGIGRNLAHLTDGRNPAPVGVDHNPTSVGLARERGFEAWTDTDFLGGRAGAAATPGSFDALLAAHLVEHLPEEAGREVLGRYLPFLRPGGRVVLITPQEKGFPTDPTHVRFCGFAELSRLAGDLGLTVLRQYSFPFPRPAGRVFTYNEFVVIARKG
jgi:2-polyprenyl-3-methyl-5-hydroxy-6-metoxy-1,4-benzoquinol methylase